MTFDLQNFYFSLDELKARNLKLMQGLEKFSDKDEGALAFHFSRNSIYRCPVCVVMIDDQLVVYTLRDNNRTKPHNKSGEYVYVGSKLSERFDCYVDCDGITYKGKNFAHEQGWPITTRGFLEQCVLPAGVMISEIFLAPSLDLDTQVLAPSPNSVLCDVNPDN
ncbi:hypothetical protein N9Z27_01340 [Alphaproteobacteria bacterium]|nr:hypothetical protein [Alphaproteobacteria bacterium]